MSEKSANEPVAILLASSLDTSFLTVKITFIILPCTSILQDTTCSLSFIPFIILFFAFSVKGYFSIPSNLSPYLPIPEDGDPEEVTVYEFPIMGYKNKSREGIVW